MNETYQVYMQSKFPQDAHSQWNKCVEFSTAMQKDFPELTLRKGYVFSFQNLDKRSPRLSEAIPPCMAY